MTQRITLSITPEKKKLLERLARQRHTSMSGVLDKLLDEATIRASTNDEPLLGDLLSSLNLKEEFAGAANTGALLSLLRNKSASKR